MKKIIFSILASLLFLNISQAKEIKVGDIVPDFEIQLIGGNKFSDKNLKGKITIIDMWATWCSPCIGSMKKLGKLQSEFGNDLQVIAVSSEEESRIVQFMSKIKINIDYSVDHKVLSGFFPHRVIPHSIIINQKGKVAAITSPGNINAEVIKDLLVDKKVNLPLKVDNVTFSYTEDYFKMDTTTRESFIIQSGVPGVGSVSIKPEAGPFAGRRVSMINFPIDGLYRYAYQTTAYRMEYEMDESAFDYQNKENLYALDLIVDIAQKAGLYDILKDKVANSFSVKARTENRTREVIVLSSIKDGVVNLDETATRKRQNSGGDHFKADDTLQSFADYLEGYGIVGKAVIDETGLDGFYRIDFNFSPEDPQTFHEAIKKMGLKLKKVEREIEVLVIYQ